MRLFRVLIFFFSIAALAQTNSYTISFDKAEHHEAKINVKFPELSEDTLRLRMSRSSPGRYALHEFAKNVYEMSATNSKGDSLQVLREDPYSWKIYGHDGTVNLTYTLFGNRADGTYTQINKSHAHLNIPATFIYSEELRERPVQVSFDISNHPGWKVATQLKHLNNNTYYAPNLYYFMDSPTEISDYDLRAFKIDGQNIRFALHHRGTEAEFDGYFEKVKKIVRQQKEIFGELPNFDYGEYTFLACYFPGVSGDGMEHRNSTVLTTSTSLGDGGMDGNIATVAHEFFHAWNVERIRPESLEPFDFSEANMSGALWFAEGFTSYYTNLTLVRAGIITPEEYVERLNWTFNYVWNSPARFMYGPVEMSYQAAFVDAASSIDPVNTENTFISYYSYGNMLGLALDLKLRKRDLNLDDFMKLVWQTYGKTEIPYDLKDLESSLATYAGKEFAEDFFNNYIYKGGMPEFNELFKHMGLELERASKKAFFGPSVEELENSFYVRDNPQRTTPAYKAGISQGDRIIALNGSILAEGKTFEGELEKFEPGERIEIEIERRGEKLKKELILEQDPTFHISIDETAEKKALKAREKWLSAK